MIARRENLRQVRHRSLVYYSMDAACQTADYRVLDVLEREITMRVVSSRIQTN